MLIAKFYDNQEIFITGGSGFIGKALIEKLIRSCPRVGKIFVLLRSKKGKNAEQRLQEILKTSLFNRVRQECPEALRKVFAISGDCAELNLGISVEDLERLQNISLVFHAAASVRFDDELRDAVLLNVRGTHELIKLAATLKKLKLFVHVSTTYCNPKENVVEEKVYAPLADWQTTIKLAETYNNETLNIFNMKYSKYQPNTYTFTKSLAEQIIQDYRAQLPCIIFRPSIVISSLQEPVPGWVDNFNGPIGLLVACGVGILRTNYGDPDIVSDFVPVDVVIRCLLIATCDNGSKEEGGLKMEEQLTVINCATSDICPVTIGQILDSGKRLIRNNPMEQTIYVPGGNITRCWFWNFYRFLTFHILMALVVDTGLRLANKKPFLLKLQRRIYAANRALYYFLTKSWVFKNDHFVALDGMIQKSERETFGYLQFADFDIDAFLWDGIGGAKEFLLKESRNSSRAARLRMKFLITLDFVIKFIATFFVVRYLVHFVYRTYL